MYFFKRKENAKAKLKKKKNTSFGSFISLDLMDAISINWTDFVDWQLFLVQRSLQCHKPWH